MDPISEQSFLILAVLANQPLHGYGLVTAVAAMSENRIRLRASAIYTTLEHLVARGLIQPERDEVESGWLRRYYRLTDAGTAAVEAEIQRTTRRARAAVSQYRLCAPEAGAPAQAERPSPAARTDPLERRYRRLVRLLPADHQAARGEELLGLLLDLDSGRTRPSPRQAVGMFGLAMRLRRPGAASFALAVVLIAYTTEIGATAYRFGTDAASVTVGSGVPFHSTTLALLVPALLRLAITAAWILGARRTALAIGVALLAYSPATAGVLLDVDLVLFIVLGVAAALRWPAPRPRAVLLTALPVAILLWILSAAVFPQPHTAPQLKLLSAARCSSPSSSRCAAP